VSDFFKQPVLNSPYDYPGRHWGLDGENQPTDQVLNYRRTVSFITPIPKPKGRSGNGRKQRELVLDEGRGLSTEEQQYDTTSVVNGIRDEVYKWRLIPDPNDWRVTPDPCPWASG
jgi:type III restriction enzyme